MFLGIVGFFDSCQYFEGDVGIILGCFDQCFDVFWEIRVIIVVVGVEKVIIDVWIGVDVLVDYFDVGFQYFGEIGQFVYEIDMGCQYCVGGIFG